MSLSSANYESAVALLKERYGDPQEIINAHMNAVVNLPIIENACDLKALRHLYDEVEVNVRALSALGRKAEEYVGLLLPLMFHKIPKEIRLSICNKVSKENWNLEAVLRELKQELSNRERCDYSAVAHSGDTSTKEDQNCPLLRSQGAKEPPLPLNLWLDQKEIRNLHVFTVASIIHVFSVLLSPMLKSARKF